MSQFDNYFKAVDVFKEILMERREKTRLLSVNGAYCYTFQVEGKLQLKTFQTIPNAITEVHLLHANQVFMMQLASDPQYHDDYRQAVGTLLGTLRWK